MDLFIQSIIATMLVLTVVAVENNVTTNGDRKVDDDDDDIDDSVGGGRWGPWTAWSLCGQSCGYGTQYRIRKCHRLSQKNMSCHGPTKQFKICNAGTCPPEHRSYRRVECAKHNHIFYGTRRYHWIPYINDQSPCELSCKSVGYGYYARFKTNVEDGVICNEENTATCIEGKCLKSGCDGILGSGSREDICGVCGGRGDTCRIISGIYTRTHLTYRGYNIVVVIPAGARGINVTEISRSKNHLALSTPRGYFLNGNLRLQALGSIRGAGTEFNYRRGWKHGCRGECLTADGPINTSVRVELIYFGRNPGIMYSYAVPNNDNGKGRDNDDDEDSDNTEDGVDAFSSRIQVKERPTYIADRLSSTDRQKLQQTNRQQERYLQDAKAARRDPYKIIRHKQSKIISRQKNTEKHRRPRIKMTVTRKVGPRNKSVEDVQYRHYYHTNALDGIGDIPVKGDRGSRLPSSYKKHSEQPSTKERQVKTRLHSSRPSPSTSNIDDNNIPLPDTDSNNQTKDKTTDDSKISYKNYQPSPRQGGLSSRGDGIFSWRISGFTDCTEPCGGGLQQTRVVCIKSDSQVEVIEENCDVTARPHTTTVVCNNQPCDASWAVSQWSACSVSCGRGLRKREVDCQQRISPTLTIPVPLTTCPSPRPQSRQYCQLDPCYKWKPSNWSKCSTVCGFGQRSRMLTCIDTQGKEVKNHLCTLVKPTTEEICDMGSCAQGWFHSKWTKECSAECGRGNYVRRVYCSAPDGSPLDENKCGGDEKKPREMKSCKAPQPCGGHWFAGPWSKCNDTCGSDAFRHREVLCIKQHGKRVRGISKNHNCDESKKPSDSEPCVGLPDCKPQWYMMPWSNCSKPCDTGVRTREVTCLDVNLKQSPDCDKKKKPSIRQSCNTLPCQQNFSEFSGAKTQQILQQDGTIIDVPACEDKNGKKLCHLVSQARLCNYYKDVCCHSCQHNKVSKG